MTLIDLKKSIHEKIDNSNDQELLEMINAMLTAEDKALQSSILLGYMQSVQGLTRPHVEVMQEFIQKYS